VTQQEKALVAILRNSTRALAGYAAAESDRAAADKYADPSQPDFDEWQDLLAARLEDLAVAVMVGRPELFVQQVLWAEAVLKSRGVAPELFRARLHDMRQVLVDHIPAELSPLATAHVDSALLAFDGESLHLAKRLAVANDDEKLAARYLVAILEGDRQEARRLITEAADAGLTEEHLYLRVLQPAQQELGRMWMLGEVNVAEEHFATTTTRMAMAQLHARAGSSPSNGKTLIAAAVAGNQHDLGIQMVADLFETDGWRVIQLGANVPHEDLAQAVEFYSADVVALAVSLASQLPSLAETIATVRASSRGHQVKIIVGGCRLPNMAEIVKKFGADGFASDAQEAIALGKQLAGIQGSS